MAGVIVLSLMQLPGVAGRPLIIVHCFPHQCYLTQVQRVAMARATDLVSVAGAWGYENIQIPSPLLPSAHAQQG